jgi:hypothetical protein
MEHADAIHSGPGGAIALVFLSISIPFSFPYPGPARFFSTLVSERAWRRVDFLGAFTSLGASILLVFALEQAGTEYPWNGAAIIASFVLSGVGWVVFISWERRLSLRDSVCEPMFPWRLACNRFVLGLLL